MLDRLGGVAVIVELEFAAPLEDKKQAAENALIDLRLPASANLVRIIRIYSASALRFHGVHAPPGSDHQPNRIITLTRESADESRPVANVLEAMKPFPRSNSLGQCSSLNESPLPPNEFTRFPLEGVIWVRKAHGRACSSRGRTVLRPRRRAHRVPCRAIRQWQSRLTIPIVSARTLFA
jgi:hypothetical protein